ncbi:MAG: carboxymuconolactone decarboxylase family protein [Phycisphaeraceae bacterium]
MALNAHTIENASKEARGMLEQANNRYGFVPNLLGVMANAPALLEAYMTLSGLFDKTSLSPTERQVVLLSVSATNECGYCVAAHTAIAQMQGVDSDVVDAIRCGKPIEDEKLESLRRFAEDVVTSRGWPGEGTKKAFHDAGYTEAHGLEVILGVGMKTLSNYTNHQAETELDDAFVKTAWKPYQSG